MATDNIHIITETAGINTIGYPTCRTWSRDGKSLFVESERPRPDGSYRPPERELLKIDIADGRVTHLATIEAEDVSVYGKGHLEMSSQYHADYAPLANVIVFSDMTGHNMYLLDVETGRKARIVHEPEGTIGDPPSISPDGTRVAYYANYPAVENRLFTDRLSVIFCVDVDPENLEAQGEPRIVVSFPGTKGPKYAESPKDMVLVNHCQISPTDRDRICYAHEFRGYGIDGSLLKNRCWTVRADGSDNRPAVRQPADEGHTHEVIGPLGRELYYVDRKKLSVCAVNLETGEKRTVFVAEESGPNHITVSPDERLIAADMWVRDGADEKGNPMSGVLLVDTKTGQQRVLCRFGRHDRHPGHPHPNFSPDGTKVAFTVADGPYTQVAWADVSGIEE